MEQELWTCAQVIEYLGIKMNNLRQIQHRGTIKWVKKVSKEVMHTQNHSTKLQLQIGNYKYYR